jgi:site-specific DNA-methyltransferase (adenine-specific)
MTDPHPSAEIINGDSREKLKLLPDSNFDSCVTDPPYGLSQHSPEDITNALAAWASGKEYLVKKKGFMGNTWDSFVPGPELWQEVYRVLKPGGHVLCFAGSRTDDLMGIALRLAGFEIRDKIMWIYGNGFPKSLNIGKAISTTTSDAKQWDGWGTALKPAFEPIIVARKPLVGTVAANVMLHGTGGINVDGCRVPIDPVADASQLRTMTRNLRERDGWGMSTVSANTPTVVRTDGRFPANIIHDGSDEVEKAFAEFGERPGQQGRARTDGALYNSVGMGDKRAITKMPEPRNDAVTASRFFYSAKATKTDRAGSKHPTIKPIALMRYLCRLVTPNGGLILDPFAGSGTTLQAANEEGFSVVGIEREFDFVVDIKRRLAAKATYLATKKEENNG